MHSLDDEALVETLTLDRIRKDVKRKRVSDWILLLIWFVIRIVIICAVIWLVILWNNSEAEPTEKRECLVAILLLSLDIVVSVTAFVGYWYPFLRLISLPRGGVPVLWTDRLLEKQRPLFIDRMLGMPGLRILGLPFRERYRFLFYGHGAYDARWFERMYTWSQTVPNNPYDIYCRASEDSKYFLVSLDGKRIDMIYNANWFVLSDEVKALLVNDAVGGGISPLPD